MRKRSANVILGALMAAASLTACGSSEPDPDYSELCVDEKTRQRVDDDHCDDDDSRSRGFMYFYMPYAHPVPAVGGVVDTSKGSFTKPSTGRIAPVSRSGFGGRATGGGS